VKGPLIIGCGNTLRGDDAAGIRAAELIAREHPGLDVVTVHGPIPDLAEQCAGRPVVFFCDASTRGESVTLRRAEEEPGATPAGAHSLPAGAIPDLSRILYGQGPGEFWIVEIPASDFSFGEQLSPRTDAAVRDAADRVRTLLRNR
jgi:hydrogenase maturation protease